LLTTTFRIPAVPAGVIAVKVVDDVTVTAVALAPPIVTVAPDTNPVPMIVTDVPPALDPAFGEIAEIVGAG
jgi:hypothetical protein